MYFRNSTLSLLLFLFYFIANAQKVGVVLSGGGSSAIAHIGVLKALEENNIPIDYITGSSMGAFIGALYASGYSPQQIEDYITSQDFENVAYGELDGEFGFFFKQRELDPSFFGIKIAPNKPLRNSLPTNVYDSKYFDFEMMAIFAQAEMVADYKFDSLFIPFRCIASDVYGKKIKIFESGHLNQAVRASMTYPFYFYPIEIDSVLYFDGGLYNNFPRDVMDENFSPDIIIGSNVSSNAPKPEANDLFSQLENMLTEKSEYQIDSDHGVILNLDIDIGTFDFAKGKQAIAIGYQKTIESLSQIKGCIPQLANADSLKKKRELFNAKKKPLKFSSKLTTTGISKSQNRYIESSFNQHKDRNDLKFTKTKYFKIYADDKVSFIFPTATFQPETDLYKLNLDVTKEKDLEISLGGILSSAPINTGYLALKYNMLKNLAWSLKGNLFFGKFYQSAQLSASLDVPFKIPFYIEPFVNVNKYDYFKNRVTVFDEVEPPFILTKEFYLGLKLGFPFVLKSMFTVDYKYFSDEYKYFSNPDFELKDTSDFTNFNGNTVGATIEKFNLNYKQYASSGVHLYLDARFISGKEESEYTISQGVKVNNNQKHAWVNAHFLLDAYPVNTKYYSLGINVEANISNAPKFSNYFGTLISYNSYNPIPEATTLFQPNFRARNWVGAGVMNVFKPMKKLQIRLEGYIFQPFHHISPGDEGQVFESDLFEFNYFIFSGAIVYHTRIGPISLNFNYYDDNFPEKSISINFGYTLFNKSAWKQ